jgi:hypothetical protein
MMATGTTIVIMVVVVDGVIMVDGVITEAVVDGGRVPILMSTLARLTPPTDTMRILLHMVITDTPHMGTMGDTRTKDYAMVYCKRLRRCGEGEEWLKS